VEHDGAAASAVLESATAPAAAAAIPVTPAPIDEKPSSRSSLPPGRLSVLPPPPTPPQHPATQTPFRGLLPNPSMSPEATSPNKRCAFPSPPSMGGGKAKDKNQRAFSTDRGDLSAPEAGLRAGAALPLLLALLYRIL
jgi:hypothetical protein